MFFPVSFRTLFYLGLMIWGYTFSLGATTSSPLSSALQKAQQAVVSLYVLKPKKSTASLKDTSPSTPEKTSCDVLDHPHQDLSLGSGVIIALNGLIVTSYHLVKDALKIETVLFDGRKSSAKITHTNPALDLALLKCSSSLTRQIPIMPLGPDTPPELGEEVWAIGQLEGLPQSVSQGIVAYPQRRLPTYPAKLIQTDILLGPGSSGGALINQQGELIGITTAVFTDRSCSHIGFAIGIPLIKLLLSSLP